MKRLLLISVWTAQVVASSPSFLEDLAKRLDELDRQTPTSPGSPTKKNRLQRELQELQVRLAVIEEHCKTVQSNIDAEQRLQQTDLEHLASFSEQQQRELRQEYAQTLMGLHTELEHLQKEKKELQQELPSLSLQVAAAQAQHQKEKLLGIDEAREQRDAQYDKNEQHLAKVHNRINSQLTAAELAQYSGPRGPKGSDQTSAQLLHQIKETEERVWQLSKELTEACTKEGRTLEDATLLALQTMKDTAERLKHEMGKLLAHEYPEQKERDAALVALLQAQKQATHRPEATDDTEVLQSAS